MLCTRTPSCIIRHAFAPSILSFYCFYFVFTQFLRADHLSVTPSEAPSYEPQSRMIAFKDLWREGERERKKERGGIGRWRERERGCGPWPFTLAVGVLTHGPHPLGARWILIGCFIICARQQQQQQKCTEACGVFTSTNCCFPVKNPTLRAEITSLQHFFFFFAASSIFSATDWSSRDRAHASQSRRCGGGRVPFMHGV